MILWHQRITGSDELHARIYDGAGGLSAELTPLASRDVMRGPAAVAVGAVFAPIAKGRTGRNGRLRDRPAGESVDGP